MRGRGVMHKSYEQYKPTKKQVFVPFIIFVIAIFVGSSCLFIAKTLGVEEERTIFSVPASQTVSLEEVGNYTIYLATDMTFEGEKYTIPEGYKGLDVKVTHNQKEVTLSTPESIYQYGEEGNQYIDVYTFMAEETGEYAIDCKLKDEKVEKAVLLVGRTQEHIAAVLGLTTIGCIIIIMGVCQFIGYLLYNGVNYGIYYFKKTQGM